MSYMIMDWEHYIILYWYDECIQHEKIPHILKWISSTTNLDDDVGYMCNKLSTIED